MRFLTYLLIVAFALGSFQSCVSKKKYDDLVTGKSASDAALADTQNNAAKTPEVVTLVDTINPAILKAVAGVSLLLLLIIWLRRRLAIAKPLPANDSADSHHASVEPSSSPAEDDVPQLKSFDLSSINLDFEPVVTPVALQSSHVRKG